MMTTRPLVLPILWLVLVACAGAAAEEAPTAAEPLQTADVYVGRLRESLDSIKTLAVNFVASSVGTCTFQGETQTVSVARECSLLMKGDRLFLSEYEYNGSKQREETLIYDGKLHRVNRSAGIPSVSLEPLPADYVPAVVDWLLPHRQFVENLPEDLSEVVVKEITDENGEKLVELSYENHMVRLNPKSGIVGWETVSPLGEDAYAGCQTKVTFIRIPEFTADQQHRVRGAIRSQILFNDHSVFPAHLVVTETNKMGADSSEVQIDIQVNSASANEPIADEAVQLKLTEGMRVEDRSGKKPVSYMVNAQGEMERPWFWERWGDRIVQGWPFRR